MKSMSRLFTELIFDSHCEIARSTTDFSAGVNGPVQVGTMKDADETPVYPRSSTATNPTIILLPDIALSSKIEKKFLTSDNGVVRT